MPERIKLANFVEGVSTQAPGDKEAHLFDEQINWVPDPTLQCVSRAGTERVAKLFDNVGPESHWHVSDSRDGNEFFMAVTAFGIQVWDANGVSYPVYKNDGSSDPPDYTYLQTQTAGNLIVNPLLVGSWSATLTGASTFGAVTGLPYPLDFTSNFELLQDAAENQSTVRHSTGDTFPTDTIITYSTAIRSDTPLAVGAFLNISVGGATFDPVNDPGFQTIVFDGTNWIAAAPAGSGYSGVTLVNSNTVNVGNGWLYVEFSFTVAPGSALDGEVMTVTHDLRYFGPNDCSLQFGVPRLETGALPANTFFTAPQDSFKTLTVKDTTWVVNTNTPITKRAALSDDYPDPDEFYIWVRQGGYLTTYTLSGTINESGGGTTDFAVDIKTWNGNPNQALPAGVSGVTRAEDIAGEFNTELTALNNSAGPGNPLFASVTNTGISGEEYGLVKVVLNSGDSVESLSVADSLGNTVLFLLHREVDDFLSLPKTFYDGVVLKVAADAGTGEDADYYVRFDATAPNSDGFGVGTWVEAMAPDIELGFEDATMPHTLMLKVDDDVGTVTGTPFRSHFTFGPETWEDRQIGDDESNPFPSFVSTDEELRYIENIFIAYNRLGFLSGDSIVMSELNQFFNFWRTTVRSLPDGDLIDVRPSSTSVGVLSSVVMTGGSIFTKTDREFYEVEGDPFVSANQISIRPALRLRSDANVEPLSIDNRILVADSSGSYVKVRELVPRQGTLGFEPIDVSKQVDGYIDGEVDLLFASDRLNMMGIIPRVTAAGENSPTAFMRSFFWDGAELLQSSWWKLQLDDGCALRFAHFIRDNLYIVVERNGSTFLERVNLNVSDLQDDEFPLGVDGQTAGSTLAVTLDGSDSRVTPPDTVQVGATYVVVADGTGASPRGTRLGSVTASSGDLVNGYLVFTDVDLSADRGWVLGRPRVARARLPRVWPKEATQNRGRHGIADPLVQVHQLLLNYRTTRYLRAEVAVSGSLAGPFSYPLDFISSAAPQTGTFRVPARGSAEKIVVDLINDEAVPSFITGGAWLVKATKRGRSSAK